MSKATAFWEGTFRWEENVGSRVTSQLATDLLARQVNARITLGVHIAVSLSFKNDQTVGNRERTKGKEGKIEMEIENDLTEGLLLPSLSPAYD